MGSVASSPTAPLSGSTPSGDGKDNATILTTPTPTPIFSIFSPKEVYWRYRGLPSNPLLVARTGPPWDDIDEPCWATQKSLRVVGNHRITGIWEDILVPNIVRILTAKTVDWSSVDPVRIGPAEERFADVVIWIAVRPQSLSQEVGMEVVTECKQLLVAHDLSDVEVEIRESEIFRSAGPPLFQPQWGDEHIFEAREPFANTLGINICAESTPGVEGTGGFFLNEGGDSQNLLLVTARHVVLPSSDNTLYEHKSASHPRHNVLVHSEASFQKQLTAITDDIEEQGHRLRRLKHTRRMLTEIEAECLLEEAKQKKHHLGAFHRELSLHWTSDDSRVLGHVVFSPPLTVGAGPERYTQDVAVIKIDDSKIDRSNFAGNTIDLGMHMVTIIRILKANLKNKCDLTYPIDRLLRLRGTIGTEEMHRPTMLDENDEPCIMVVTRGGTTAGNTIDLGMHMVTIIRILKANLKNKCDLTYPIDRLLRLRGTIGTEEMRKPTTLDENDEPCILVVTRGGTTGLTLGRANNLFSITRQRIGDNDYRESMEWCILPFDENSGPFSAKGDSGAVVVDGMGRIGGLLTCGAGRAEDKPADLTYVTPIEFILETIHGHEPLAKAYPIEPGAFVK